LRQAIEMDLISGLLFYPILILVVAFSILNTFLMAIFERTREFGVLMAIGTTPRRLTKLLLIESLSMTMIGIITGIFLGCLITWYFQIHGIELSGTSELLSQFGISGRLYPKLSLLSATIGPAIPGPESPWTPTGGSNVAYIMIKDSCISEFNVRI